MPARHRSRQRALQILFLWDHRKQAVEAAVESFYETLGYDSLDGAGEDPQPALPIPQDEFMETLVQGTVANYQGIDQRISAKSAHWRIERMAVVDRNILRLAVFEMTHTATPQPIVIDEALELARQFSGDESVAFINGVLDAIHKEDRASIP